MIAVFAPDRARYLAYLRERNWLDKVIAFHVQDTIDVYSHSIDAVIFVQDWRNAGVDSALVAQTLDRWKVRRETRVDRND